MILLLLFVSVCSVWVLYFSSGLYHLYDIEYVSVHNNFTKLRQDRRDYGFHGYGELCNFVYCLLMKTRVAGSLPGIHELDKYMSVDAASYFPVVAMDSFLAYDDFERTLMVKKTSFLIFAFDAVISWTD